MTAIEQAIKEAAEKGGWKPNYDPAWTPGTLAANRRAEIFLDPLFWQALGKARGWKEQRGWESKLQTKLILLLERNERPNAFAYGGESIESIKIFVKNLLDCPIGEIGWKNAWHRFIDHLADGKDAESFFTALV